MHITRYKMKSGEFRYDRNKSRSFILMCEECIFTMYISNLKNLNCFNTLKISSLDIFSLKRKKKNL